MKTADLVNLDFDLLGVLTRMGIPIRFGEETVAETCRRHGVDVDTFLLICNVYVIDGYRPTADVLEKPDLHDIVRYLHQSHAYYMDAALKDLASALEDMIQPCGDSHKRIIWKFFSDYKDELAKHFEYEEKAVFPLAEAVLGHTTAHDGPDGHGEDHSNMEEKLADLKNLVMKYMPPQCDQKGIYRALFYIFTFEKDLEKHTFIEDQILSPIVKHLEADE